MGNFPSRRDARRIHVCLSSKAISVRDPRSAAFISAALDCKQRSLSAAQQHITDNAELIKRGKKNSAAALRTGVIRVALSALEMQLPA